MPVEGQDLPLPVEFVEPVDAPAEIVEETRPMAGEVGESCDGIVGRPYDFSRITSILCWTRECG
jgi:hypothetical protein